MKNHTMMQYFEWYLPENGLHWRRCAAQAGRLEEAGIDMVWLPPAYKGAAGAKSVGYDVYDMYDLGEFDRRGPSGQNTAPVTNIWLQSAVSSSRAFRFWRTLC